VGAVVSGPEDFEPTRAAAPVAPVGDPADVGWAPEQASAEQPPVWTMPYAPPAQRRGFGCGALVGAAIGGAIVGGVVTIGLLVIASGVIDDALGLGQIAAHHAYVADLGDAPKVGDCLSGAPAEVDVVNLEDVVDCGTRHGSEVIGVALLPELARPPSNDDIEAAVDEVCILAFEDYVGGDYYSSDFEYRSLTPGDAAWKQGDRSVFCLLPSEDFDNGVGSARGSE
jgi:hypothetical protein